MPYGIIFSRKLELNVVIERMQGGKGYRVTIGGGGRRKRRRRRSGSRKSHEIRRMSIKALIPYYIM